MLLVFQALLEWLNMCFFPFCSLSPFPVFFFLFICDARILFCFLHVHKSSVRAVSQEQVDHLWRPQVGFINTDDIQQTQVDQDAVTTVYRRDTKYTPDLASPYEGMYSPSHTLSYLPIRLVHLSTHSNNSFLYSIQRQGTESYH